jgi:hypothetical protein
VSDTLAVEVTGLQLIDYLELEEQLPPGSVSQTPAADIPPGAYGEPMLITAVIVLSAVAAKALASWLAARHPKQDSPAPTATTAAAAPAPGITMTIAPDRTITIHLGAAASPSTPSPASMSSTSPAAATTTGEAVSDVQIIADTLLKAAGTLSA